MNTNFQIDPDATAIRSFVVGRDGHILLNDESVSREHAEITFTNSKIRLRDLNSTNGVFLLNGKKTRRIRDEIIDANQKFLLGKKLCTVNRLFESLSRTELTY